MEVSQNTQQLHNITIANQSGLHHPHAVWMSEIILHLRDDLVRRKALKNEVKPSYEAILKWTLECYYETLEELDWRQAVMSLLLRMRAKSGVTLSNHKRHFIELAIEQMERAIGKPETGL